MILDLVGAKDITLRQKSKTVLKIDKKVKKLIEDMRETLLAQNDPEGVGLAAPQIGKNLKIFLMKPDEDITVVINPKIISVKKLTKKQMKQKTKILEGCLSLPHFYGPLQRSREVTIEYLDENGIEITKTFSDFSAQVVLHEIDHLEGVLFVDRLLEQKQPLYEYNNDNWTQVELN